jgi:hypothetical protein
LLVACAGEKTAPLRAATDAAVDVTDPDGGAEQDTGDGAESEAPADAGPNARPEASSAVLPLASVPRASLALARELLGQTAGSEMTPGWSEGVHLDDLVFMYERPDVEGPAYYEFAVLDEGRITVSTGTHDTPIPQFSDTGAPLALLLLEEAEARGEQVSHLYRLDDRHAYATNAEGVIVADLSSADTSLGLYLDDYLSNLEEDATSTQKSRAQANQLYAEDWAAIYPSAQKSRNPLDSEAFTARADLQVKDIKWLYHADLLRTQIHWWQVDIRTNPACSAGCGPVAFAQVAAYLAYSDRWGNPKYVGSNLRSLYPNVSTRMETAQATAMVKELHNEFSSLCWSDMWEANDFSAAMPWNMGRFVSWASRKGAKMKFVDTWMDGDNVAAWNALRRGNPVVFGWPYDHYNVGAGTGTLNGIQYIWVNNGQKSASWDGWLRLTRSFYTGIVNSYVDGK